MLSSNDIGANVATPLSSSIHPDNSPVVPPYNSQNIETLDSIPDYNLTNSAYVPSFYDQHFQLQDILTVQKDFDTDICNQQAITQPHLPGFCAHFEPGSEISPSSEHGYPAHFNSSTAYSVTQETAILCLSDTINFYDNLSLSPEHQNDSIVSNTLSADGFITFSNNSDLWMEVRA